MNQHSDPALQGAGSRHDGGVIESACPKRDDGRHCNCWYGAYGPCCVCGCETVPMPSDRAVLAAAKAWRQMHAPPPSGYDGLPASMTISIEEQMETVLAAAYAVDAPINKRAADGDGQYACPTCGWSPGSGGLSREEQDEKVRDGLWWCAEDHDKRALVWVGPS